MTISERKLGFWETTCKFAHDVYAGTSLIMATATLSGVLNESTALTALKSLWMQHPLLRARIFHQRHDAYFNFDVDFAVINIEFFSNLSQIERENLILLEHQEPLDIEKSLWRVKIFLNIETNQHILLFILHHSISDGLSAFQMVKQFCEFYDNQNIDFENNIPQAIEELLPNTISFADLLEKKIKVQSEIKPFWNYEEKAKLIDRKMFHLNDELNTGDLSRLKSQCKKSQVTINSALNAAALLTARKIIGQAFLTTLHTPINLRNDCAPKLSENAIGCYISMVTTTHAVNMQDEFWQVAKSYQKQLKNIISPFAFFPKDMSINDFSIEELQLLFDTPGSTKRGTFSSGFAVSNLGYLENSTKHNLHIEDFMFCTNHVMGEYIIFTNALTINEKLKLCFSYCHPLISHETAKKWQDIYLNYLLSS